MWLKKIEFVVTRFPSIKYYLMPQINQEPTNFV